MRYKLLGKTGIKVSELCLGAMTFGDNWGFGASKAESAKIFDYFLNSGGNFIDTANIYTSGQSEIILSDFIKAERENLVVASKYSLSEDNRHNTSGNGRKNLVQSLEASLKRLDTDYIDLYYVHVWDFTTDPESLMRSLEYLLASGKILSIGVSDTPAWIVSRCNTIAQQRGWTPFAANQIEYCLTERTADRELLPMTEAFDMTLCGFGPLSAGLLTGKYHSKNDLPKRMKPGTAHRLSEHNMRLTQKFLDFVKTTPYTPSQIAIRWAMERFGNSSPIFGARTLEHCKENLGAIHIKLSSEQMTELNQISAISGNNPQSFFELPRINQILYGGRKNEIDGL